MVYTLSKWYAPVPSYQSKARLTLDFNLRAADLFFRELIVPELGRVWFVRQLSWSLGALAMYHEPERRIAKPTALAHAIEALACKMEYFTDGDERSRRILGVRAFGRDEDGEIRSFERLRQSINYVRNTHRQSASRAIRVEAGLGFASGNRFDLLELEPAGRALADAFLDQEVGQGGTSLRRWLFGWVDGSRDPKGGSLSRALSPETPTATECALVRARLLETSSPASEKRRQLALALGRSKELPSIEDVVVRRLRDSGQVQQAKEIVAARAFGAVLDRARDVLEVITREIEPAKGGVALATLITEPSINQALGALTVATSRFVEKADHAGVAEPTSRSFATAVTDADDRERAMMLVMRAGDLLQLSGTVVHRGPLFRVITESPGDADEGEDATSLEPDRTGRTFRIANFHALLRDINHKQSP